MDIGANIGTTSIPLAQQSACRIIAIEPVPATFQLLERNVRQNGLEDRIRCLQAAVSAEEGRRPMVLASDNAGAAEILSTTGPQHRGEADAAPETIEVRVAPLVRLLEEVDVSVSDVQLVWSDTQGHERSVLESGAELWQAGVPLFVELWPTGLEAHGGVEAFVRAARATFQTFLLKEELAGGATPRGIEDLEDQLATIPIGKHTDGLLLPDQS